MNISNLNIDNDDLPKYKKRKKSNISKAKNKSKHKHKYIECLFSVDSHVMKGTYCKICGKIGEMSYIAETDVYESEKFGGTVYRQLTAEEMVKKYNYLEVKELDGIFDNYVPVNNKIN